MISYRWFSLSLALLGSVATAAPFPKIDPATYFPAVVQGHSGATNANCNGLKNPQLTVNGQAKIEGTQGKALAFCASNQKSGMPLDSCDNTAGSRRQCTVSNNTIPGVATSGQNAFRYTDLNNSIGNIFNSSCQPGGQLPWTYGTRDQFTNIVLNNTCTLNFSAASAEYRILTLALSNGAKVVLPAGDYWIDSLQLGQGAEIELQGDVRIFVNSVADITGATINGSGAGSLLLFGYGDITLNGNTLINGNVYADGTLTLNGNAIINGRTTSKALTMASNTLISDLPSPVSAWHCYDDDFSKSLKETGSWLVNTSSGTFKPAVYGGRLRLTENGRNQATSVTYQRLFPGDGNLIRVTFNHYAHGSSRNGGDGMAVVLSDAAFAPRPGAFGGPLGYGFKPGVAGFSGGWLGVGLDEYGNFSAEGGSSNARSQSQSVAVRGSGSEGRGYNYLSGTVKLSPGIDNNPNKNYRYRLTIDSQPNNTANVTVERDMGYGYNRLINTFNVLRSPGQTGLPKDFFISLTGSTGDSSNVHEIDDVQICALKSRPIGVQVHHFEFSHSGQGLTCNPEEVTIRACADETCSSLITDLVTTTLLPASGWEGGNKISFSGGSTKVKFRKNTQGPVTFDVPDDVTTPPLTHFTNTLCRAGGGAPTTAACTLSFADSGFVFDLQDSLANKPQTVQIKAVKKDDVSKQCVPGFANVERSVDFWSGYLNPRSNPANTLMVVNGQDVAANKTTPVVLKFDRNGEAPLTVRYPDAGEVQLNARHLGSGETQGLKMEGASSFISRPVGLCITAASEQCSSNYASCKVFKKAGEAFPMQIQAMAWESDNDADICSGNLATPNFVHDGIALGTTLVSPIPGTNAAVGTSSYNHAFATNGTNSVNQTVSEVGVFRMTATPPDKDKSYFGKYTIPAATSAPIGRFLPWDFNLLSGVITPACGQFSYIGQPFGVKMVVQARNKGTGVTRNYADDFAKVSLHLVAGNNHDGVDRSGRVGSVLAKWVSGEASIDSQSRFARLSDRDLSLVMPEEPFKALRFGLMVADNESPSVSFLADTDLNPGVKNGCTKGSTCNAKQLKIPAKSDNTMVAYYGRLLAGTGAGQASVPLAIPLQMQYYEAGNWQQNKLDQCSQLSLADQGITFLNPSHSFDATTRDLNLGTGRTIKLGLGEMAPGAMLALAKDGEILFHFAKPEISVRIPYKVDLLKQPSQPSWLSDLTSPNGSHLQGEAKFGSTRGNDRIIYRRELM